MSENKKNLIVITGAGASAGCHTNALTSKVEEYYRPPLTKDLFSNKESFQKIRLKFRTLEAVVADIHTRQHLDTWNLESYLNELKVAAETDIVQRRWYYETLYYLQELISTVSNQFLPMHGRGANAYTQLVTSIWHYRELFESVCFVTLNYDTFLDSALQDIFFHQFSSMDSYLKIKDSQWSYIKLHGSCNWFRKLRPDIKIASLLDRGAKVEEYLTDEVLIEPVGSTVDAHLNNRFPIIAVPIGQYVPICPQSHQDKLGEIIRQNELYVIVIGFGGVGDDLFSAFRTQQAKIKKVAIVDCNNDSLIKVKTRFHDLGVNDFADSLCDSNAFSLFSQKHLRGKLEGWKKLSQSVSER